MINWRMLMLGTVLLFTSTGHAESIQLTTDELLKYCRVADDSLTTYDNEFIHWCIDSARDLFSGVADFNDGVSEFRDNLDNYILFLDCYIVCDSCKSCISGIKNSLCGMDGALLDILSGLLRAEPPKGIWREARITVIAWLSMQVFHVIRYSSPFWEKYCAFGDIINIRKLFDK